ncbi:MAG: ABC transporter permease subunit [Clostridia bacterium]|nr:ABC transporter permease subunit [Clostridia bacterium]
MKKITLKNLIHTIPTFPFFILAVMYMILPMLSIVVNGFLDPSTHAVSMANFTKIFSKTVYVKCITNSLKLSFISTFVGLALSFLIALCLTNVGAKMRTSIMAILSMTSNFAGLPLAFAFILIVGNTGVFKAFLQTFDLHWLDGFNLYSYDGIMMIFIYFQIPLGTMLLVPSFDAIRKEWKEAAVLMRASDLRFWAEVGIPNLIPGIFGTFGMLFANALTAYATVYVLVTNNFPLLATKITSLFTGDAVPQKELGSAMSIIMIAIMLLVIGACNLLVKLTYKGGEQK